MCKIQKHMAIATITGTLIAAVIYIVSTIVVMGVIPITHLAHTSAPYADAATKNIRRSWKLFCTRSGLGNQLGTFSGQLVRSAR